MSAHGEVAAEMARCFQAGDIEGVLKVLHPDVVVRESRALPYPGEWRGHAGFTELVGTMTALFDVALTDCEIVDGGETVCTRSALRLVPKGGGDALETSLIELYRFADGVIVDIDVFYKDPSAVRELAG